MQSTVLPHISASLLTNDNESELHHGCGKQREE
jgi:hypothetical protein